MYLVSVIDTLLGDITASFSASLGPGASETKTFSYTVLADDPDPLPNSVTVTYEDELGVDKTDTADCRTYCIRISNLTCAYFDENVYFQFTPI